MCQKVLKFDVSIFYVVILVCQFFIRCVRKLSDVSNSINCHSRLQGVSVGPPSVRHLHILDLDFQKIGGGNLLACQITGWGVQHDGLTVERFKMLYYFGRT